MWGKYTKISPFILFKTHFFITVYIHQRLQRDVVICAPKYATQDDSSKCSNKSTHFQKNACIVVVDQFVGVIYRRCSSQLIFNSEGNVSCRYSTKLGTATLYCFLEKKQTNNNSLIVHLYTLTLSILTSQFPYRKTTTRITPCRRCD